MPQKLNMQVNQSERETKKNTIESQAEIILMIHQIHLFT